MSVRFSGTGQYLSRTGASSYSGKRTLFFRGRIDTVGTYPWYIQDSDNYVLYLQSSGGYLWEESYSSYVILWSAQYLGWFEQVTIIDPVAATSHGYYRQLLNSVTATPWVSYNSHSNNNFDGSGGTLYVGGKGTGAGGCTVDDFKYWNRELTIEEIRRGLAGPPSNSLRNELSAWLPMDSPSDCWVDRSDTGLGFNFTLTGTPTLGRPMYHVHSPMVRWGYSASAPVIVSDNAALLGMCF